MLTSLITAGIAAVLTFFGVEPGLYIAPLWIAVKVVIVAIIAAVMWRQRRR